VTSSVLCLKARDEAPVSADEKFLFAVIRASFNQRRKTIANGIVSGLEHDDTDKNITREDVQKCLSEMGLKEDVRGEKLSLEEFADLSEKLRNMR
jgi:16S rRNA (adenine1518-N6/adenine1519-N6)-dimethyltransferase